MAQPRSHRIFYRNQQGRQAKNVNLPGFDITRRSAIVVTAAPCTLSGSFFDPISTGARPARRTLAASTHTTEVIHHDLPDPQARPKARARASGRRSDRDRLSRGAGRPRGHDEPAGDVEPRLLRAL